MDTDTAQTIGLVVLSFACFLNTLAIMRDRD